MAITVRNNSMVLCKGYKVSISGIRLDLKPFGSFFAGNPQLFQIRMEIFICECVVRLCIVAA